MPTKRKPQLVGRDRHLLRRAATHLRVVAKHLTDVDGKCIVLSAAGEIDLYLKQERYRKAPEKAAEWPSE